MEGERLDLEKSVCKWTVCINLGGLTLYVRKLHIRAMYLATEIAGSSFHFRDNCVLSVGHRFMNKYTPPCSVTWSYKYVHSALYP